MTALTFIAPICMYCMCRVFTFEEVCCESCFINSPVRHEFHPQSVGGGADIFGFIIAAESTDQRADIGQAVSNLQVVVCAVIVPLDLHTCILCVNGVSMSTTP